MTDKANVYARELVEITGAPSHVSRKSMNVVPSLTYSTSMVTDSPHYKDLLERRTSKRRMYIYMFNVFSDDLMEEVSHEVRLRVYNDVHNIADESSVAEFYGMVGRILIKDSIVDYQIPKLDELEKLKNKSNTDLKIVNDEIAKMKENSPDIFYKPTSELMNAMGRKYLSHIYLTHSQGYEAAVKNADAIRQYPRGIYSLSAEEVKQRFFEAHL